MSDLTATETEQLALFREGLKKLADYEAKLKRGIPPAFLAPEFKEIQFIDAEIVRMGVSEKLAKLIHGLNQSFYEATARHGRLRIISAKDFGSDI